MTDKDDEDLRSLIEHGPYTQVTLKVEVDDDGTYHAWGENPDGEVLFERIGSGREELDEHTKEFFSWMREYAAQRTRERKEQDR